MRMVDALVKRTDTKVSDSGRLLESFLKAAADEKGEWELPLSPGKYGAMEQASPLLNTDPAVSFCFQAVLYKMHPQIERLQ